MRWLSVLVARLCLWLGRGCLAVADWLDPPPPPPPPAPPPPPEPTYQVTVVKDALWDRALALTAEMAKIRSSGEYKRHQVYSRLQKEFPERTHQALGVVIEAVLQHG